MDLTKKLAIGVGGWLQFEYHCAREGLFNEKYLTVPIGQILFAEYGKKVIAEVNHPILSKYFGGAGRRPQIDFAILDPDPTIAVAIESKWVGKTSIGLEQIIWDLVRLELIAFHLKATALFLLGGKSGSLSKIFASDAFQAPRPNGKGRPVLRPDNRRAPGLRLDSPPSARLKIMKKIFKRYPDIPMPSRISCGKPSIFPEFCPSRQYKVFVWQIKPYVNRDAFIPRSHKLYNTA